MKGAIGEKGIQQKAPMSPDNAVPQHVVNGTILKTALTNPSEVSTTARNHIVGR